MFVQFFLLRVTMDATFRYLSIIKLGFFLVFFWFFFGNCSLFPLEYQTSKRKKKPAAAYPT